MTVEWTHSLSTPCHPPLLTKVGRGPEQAKHSLSGGMGPLSRLPPWPGVLQKGGAQPRKQWQFWLLLQTWSEGRARVSAPQRALLPPRARPHRHGRRGAPGPRAHAPHGRCTSSRSLLSQRRRCSCTAPRSRSVVRRKPNCQSNGRTLAGQQEAAVLRTYGTQKWNSIPVISYSEKLKMA